MKSFNTVRDDGVENESRKLTREDYLRVIERLPAARSAEKELIQLQITLNDMRRQCILNEISQLEEALFQADVIRGNAAWLAREANSFAIDAYRGVVDKEANLAAVSSEVVAARYKDAKKSMEKLLQARRRELSRLQSQWQKLAKDFAES